MEFEAILEELGEQGSVRIAYFNGILDIRVPLPEHEKPKELTSEFGQGDAAEAGPTL